MEAKNRSLVLENTNFRLFFFWENFRFLKSRLLTFQYNISIFAFLINAIGALFRIFDIYISDIKFSCTNFSVYFTAYLNY